MTQACGRAMGHSSKGEIPRRALAREAASSPPSVASPYRMKKPLALGALMIAAIGPTDAQAQGPAREAYVSFAPGNGSRNGYTSASIDFKYMMINCAGDLTISYRMNSPSINTGARGYYYRGKWYQVPSEYEPPKAPSSMKFSGRITRGVGGSYVGSFNDQNAIDMWGGCLGQGQAFAKISDVLGTGSTEAQRKALEEQLIIHTTNEADPLRNVDFERHIDQLAADARRDSIQHAQEARADSLKRARAERDDSLARERYRDSIHRAEQQDSIRTAREERDDSVAQTSRSDSVRRARARSTTSSSTPRETSAADRERDGKAMQVQADIFAMNLRAYSNAESYFSAGNYQQAIPLYQQLLGTQYDAQARKRLKDIEALGWAQVGVATAQVLAPMAKAFGQYMGDNYPGLGFGINYTSSYFKGDDGMIGITYTMNDRVDLFPFMPYLDLALSIDKDEYPYTNSGKMDMSIALGSTIPKFGWGVDTRFEPHLAWHFISGTIHATSSSRSEDKDFNLLMFGLMMIQKNGFIRLDVTPMGGTMKFGGAMGYIF
jgi:hypothetical protein